MGIRRALLAIAAMLVSISQPSAALAECADLPSLEDALRAAPVAFVGEVTSAGLDTDEAVVSVQWIWKGPDLSPVITLQTPNEPTLSGEPGFRFRAGTRYIVFLDDTDRPYEVSECSGTRRYRGDGQAIPADLQLVAGAAEGRAPGASVGDATASGGIGWAYIAIGMILVVASIALAVRAYVRSRRSRPASERLKRRIPAVSSLLSSRRTAGDRRTERLRGRKRK